MNTSFFGAAVRALPTSRKSAATRVVLAHNLLSILYHYAVCPVGILQATATEVIGTSVDRGRLRSLKLVDATEIILEKLPGIKAYAVKADGKVNEFELSVGDLTDDERKIILAGCLINFYRN